MYTVFSIEHPSTSSVYIGYCRCDGATPVEHFLRGAQRPETDRKDVEFLSQCDDSSQLSWRSISEAENEWEALVARNIARVSNPRSFTGPSMWPLGAYERAQKELGEDVQRPFSAWKALEQRTARAAYEMGCGLSKRSRSVSLKARGPLSTMTSPNSRHASLRRSTTCGEDDELGRYQQIACSTTATVHCSPAGARR